MNASPYTRIVQGYEPSLGLVGVGRQLINANHNWRVWRFMEALALRLKSTMPSSEDTDLSRRPQ